jgi:hypothetical protein
MEREITADVIEINDPEIDPVQIMATIRQRIAARRAALGYEQRTFPSFGAASYPGEPQDLPYDADLYYYLRLVNTNYAEVETAPLLAASPATRLPILGKLWQMIRGGAHNLVLFYVNRLVSHQTMVNSYLVSVLNRMSVVQSEQQRTIAQLQAEVAALRQAPPGEKQP